MSVKRNLKLLGMYLQHPLAVALIMSMIFVSASGYAMHYIKSDWKVQDDFALNYCKSKWFGKTISYDPGYFEYECWSSDGKILGKLPYRFVESNVYAKP